MGEPVLPVVDLVIVGGGPVGLFGAYYGGMRGMTMRIVDSLPQLGGQLTALYPEKFIYDVPGFPRVLAKDLARNLVEQAMQFRPEVHLGAAVTGLEYDEVGKVYTLMTEAGGYGCRALLISTGIGKFSPKVLPVPEAGRFVNRGLLYALQSLEPLRGSRVLVVGGGDSALDWANTLVPITHSVTLVHRSDRFRAHEDSVRKLTDSPARVLTFHEVKELRGEDHVRQAVVYDNRSKQEEVLEVDWVVASLGFDTTLGALEGFGLELKGNKVVVDSRMRTSRAGVFGAGDVVTYDGKLPLIATGFGEAAVAVNFAKTYVDPGSRAFPGHSTDRG